MNDDKQQRLIIISGLSGGGKSVALNTLEDLGFYCIDNLPVSLLEAFASQIVDGTLRVSGGIAIGIDARNPESDITLLPELIASLKEKNLEIELVFIEADDDALTKRFSETRRKHPLSSDTVSLTTAIRRERSIMEELSVLADMRIDTSNTLLHELRDQVRQRIAMRPLSSLSIQFVSFGFKHGIPPDADFVFDVRCLPNPHWKKNLRPHSGKDDPVIKFLKRHKPVSDMIDDIRNFLDRWIPVFEADNRSYLSVAVGCTGGRHRSVYITEQLAGHFRSQNKHVIINHRDI